jgi:hypothetical protein
MKTVHAQDEAVQAPQVAVDVGSGGEESLINKQKVIDIIQKSRGVKAFTVKEVKGKGTIITVETEPAVPPIMRSQEAQQATRAPVEHPEQPVEVAEPAMASNKVHVKIALSNEGVKKAVAGRYPSAFLKAMGMR